MTLGESNVSSDRLPCLRRSLWQVVHVFCTTSVSASSDTRADVERIVADRTGACANRDGAGAGVTEASASRTAGVNGGALAVRDTALAAM